MAKCWYCGDEIVEGTNSSKEHVLPDFLGGARGFHSRGLLCLIHNTNLGRFVDSELDKKFGFLSTALSVERDRPPEKPKIFKAYTKDGVVKHLREGMRGGQKLQLFFDEKEVIIPFRTREDLEAAKEKKLLEVQRSGKFTVSVKEIESIEIEPVLFGNTDTPGLSVWGGRKFWEALSKIAINFYLFYGGDLAQISGIINAFKDEQYTLRHFIHHYYSEQIWGWRIVNQAEESKTVYHYIQLFCEPSLGIAYCYIELFCFYKYIVVLSHSYSGPRISKTYAYDLITECGIVEKLQVDFPISFGRRSFFDDLWKLNITEATYRRSLVEYFNEVVQIIENRQEELIKKRPEK